MAIGDLLKSLGQGIDRGFTKIGGYDPSQQVSQEEAFRRKNIGIENLQRTLGRSAAIMSGDPQRLALSAQQDEAARKKQFMDDYIRKNPGQAELLRALQAGVPASMLTKKPTKGPSSYEEYIRTDSTPTEAEYLAFLENQKRAGATNINLDQKRDTIFAQEAAKAGFATKKEVDKQITQDKQLLTRIKMSKRQLLDGVKTGKIEEFLMPFKEFAVGIGVADEETVKNLGQQELFQATTNFLVPRMRVEGSGSTSDMEIELFKSAVPNLGRTSAGNLVVAGGIENLVEYNIKRQRLMDEYLQENKNLLGFGEYADKKLGPLYKSYSSDNEFDTQVKQGTLKEGDFVYDAINGQFRVLTKEDVS
ncbi:hypothetical protein N8511_00840 [Akkermansiaceae bacterium]|nr:hypothetical protein [Akkermansiaceae bacterium]